MPRLAAVKLTSCFGCLLQLATVLVSSDEFRRSFDVVFFRELGATGEGPYDIVFVEGSVSTREQEDILKKLRSSTWFLVALGTCALQGGVQSLRAGSSVEAVKSTVYPRPELIEVYPEPRPVVDVVRVDYAIPGCPVSGSSVARFLSKYALGGLPVELYESVCAECKRGGFECVVVARGVPCLGMVTQGSCGALCPSLRRGCYGCFGLRVRDLSTRNLEAVEKRLEELGTPPGAIRTLFKAYGYRSYSETSKR